MRLLADTVYLLSDKKGFILSPQSFYCCLILLPILLVVDHDLISCVFLSRPQFFSPLKSDDADRCRTILAPLQNEGKHLAPFLGLSCLFAIGLNISMFPVVGLTSPVTYDIVGQVRIGGNCF